MSWNYRIIRRVEEHHDSDEPICTMAEVFYDDDGEIVSWTEDPIWPCGSSPFDLRADMANMLKAFELPVLKESSDGKTLEPDPNG